MKDYDPNAPTLVIQVKQDGRVCIAAPAPGQIPAELMADAEEVGSLDEATQVIKDVLGAAGQEGQLPQGEQAATGATQAEEPGAEAPMEAQSDQDAAMEQGFRNVRGAPR